MKEKHDILKKKKISNESFVIYYEKIGMRFQNNELQKEKYSFENIKKIKEDPDIRFYSVFKKNSEPFYEREEFIEGGLYEFHFSSKTFQHIDFEKFMDSTMKILYKFDFMKGMRIRPKDHKIKIYFWSTEKSNDRILDILYKIPDVFHVSFDKKPSYELFYPEALPDAPDLSVVEMRGKKVYIMRFGLILSNFFYSKKIWWEIELLNVFRRYYIPHTNMLDIGANVGSHSLLMSEFVSNDSLIFSFEPVYGDIVERNIRENNLQDKICLFTQGLGKKNEVIEINIMDRMKPNNFGTVSIVKKIENTPLKKKIGVIALDSIGLKNISVIKIDVEGMEKDVLEGARQTILQNLPAIIIEIWSNEMNNFLESDIGIFLLQECKYILKPIPETVSGHDYVLVPPPKNRMSMMM
jgi:FkbM family methyltransferase